MVCFPQPGHIYIFSDTVHPWGKTTLELLNIKLTYLVHTTQSTFDREEEKVHLARLKSDLLLQVEQKITSKINEK